MELYRIAQEKYAEDLSGNGARLFGGRWNSEGQFALYTSGNRSLALLETLAHTPAKLLQAKTYQLITLFVPDTAAIQTLEAKKLPHGWGDVEISPFTQKTGDQFLMAKKNLVLAVPSVLIPEELNYVLNPLHTDFKKVKILNKRRILFDKRVQGNL
ncbi:MAG TPA: RES family NAD+ phosphorylase [Chitinophagaceae bacterium]|nr:RES family NAD+ phosphorylase [Chitinophagaceae bacterium]